MGAFTLSNLSTADTLYQLAHIVRTLNKAFIPPNKLVSVRDLVEKPLEKLLPDNAHELCSNRLGITLTRAWTLESKFVSEFGSRQELIDSVVAGCFIPVWSGSLETPKIKGVSYMDGGFTNNSPTFELSPKDIQTGRRRVFINAFPCMLDVTPSVDTWWFGYTQSGIKYKVNHHAFLRGIRSLVPVSIDKYKIYLIEGHRDMKNYILRSDLLKCQDCYFEEKQTVIIGHHDNYSVSDSTLDRLKTKQCLACLMLIEKVENLKMSDELLKILE